MHPLYFVALLSFSAAASPLVKRADPQGIDVSHYQGTINWGTVAADGVSFAYIKATEGTSTLTLFSSLVLACQLVTATAITDPDFSANYIGATDAGIIRGGYHYAHPDISDGATQANYFLAHGGQYISLQW